MQPPSSLRTIFFSPTGTSRRIAAAIARGIDPEGQPVVCDLTHGTAPREPLPADALLVVAVPVYGGRVAPAALARMDDLRGTGTPVVAVVVYGNRAFEGAAARLSAFLADRGFRTVAAAAFVGEHSYSAPATPVAEGRPDAADLAEAESFGSRIAAKLARGGATVDARLLQEAPTPLRDRLRFAAFYLRLKWFGGAVPASPSADSDRCIRCGRCAELCPVGAIPDDDPVATDPARCIRCCACVKGCPTGARTYATPFAAALARNFSRRKPPVTLL